ncbi:Tetratricopeptide repeat [Popillia japonica]|uniref:Tetratricopeptide repeat n=1 Tax=Popillia japonica TaxID=7064 RepID=A0AAW1LVX5_POPJA
MESINTGLVTQSLNFHGQQLQKLWEAERGEQDLMKHNIKDLNYELYNKRMKKANVIFSKDATEKCKGSDENVITEDMYAIMPPLETYLNVDKQQRLKYFFENVKIGNLILGTIISKTQSGMMLKVLCTTGIGATVHYVADINVKAFCPVANIIPAVDRKGVSRSYMMNDSVCCEVLEVIPDTDKMVCGMKGSTRDPNGPAHRPPLGLVSADDFPLVYKKALDHKNDSYETVLEKSVGFNNPNNISYLASQMGIDKHCSLMEGLSGRFPEQEYANELRQLQASKWAYSNVADGIDHFKAGRHTEAFQCLNKALNIDPKNVEGLVARGALFANSGNFQKAIEDFETALKLNPNHSNARKYMGETLVALGRSYEEENKLEEARKAYQSCLTIIPFHEEAQNSLEFLKSKAQGSKNLIEPNELLLPNLASAQNKQPDVNDTLKQLLKGEDEEKKEKKKKKKSKKRKSRRRSSSSSSSSSSASNDSSSSSSSSSTDSSSSSGDSDFKKRKKRRSRSHRREKQSSLSPLSKRMAMMDPTHDTPMNYQFNKPAATSSFDFAFEQPTGSKNVEQDDYEQKVRAFLEQTKGDSDYEDKVRKFLEESTKWKKEKRNEEKKKKKKKDKKSKKESKKKRKEKKRRKQFDLSEYELRDALKKELGIKDKEKRSKKHGLTSDDEDYLIQKVGYSKRFLDSLPDLEELESKLNAYYALEKETKRSELSESPKRSLLDSPSPTREQKARQAVAEATAASGAPKWKMQIGSATAGSSRFKKKPEREEWLEENEKRINKNGDMEDPRKPVAPMPSAPPDKNGSVRKMMAMKEPTPKKPPESELLKKLKPAPPAPKPVIPPGQVVLDKFGNFRLMTPPKETNRGRSKPPEPPGRPRSGSRSRSRSRSRGKYSRSRSSSMSRSRSRSYRSRSRSYYSRSRSRSDGAALEEDIMIEVPIINHVSKIHDRIIREVEATTETIEMIATTGVDVVVEHIIIEVVEDREEGSKGEVDIGIIEIGDSPKKSHDEKEKVNKYIDNDGEPIRHEGPLSEGEDRDDYTSEKYVDREAYDGKWAEKDEGGGGDNQNVGKDIPPETNIEEMDKFLNKVKKDKKEEMLERNKDFLKSKE